jgi:hypothetical protein
VNIIETISASPYNAHVKRSVYTLYISKYYTPRGSTQEDEIINVEDYVLSHGIFIGAMSKEGFFICKEVADVIEAFWLSLMDDLDVQNPSPSKLFTKKIGELYEDATKLFP